jgi:hypothetical protein
MVALCTAAKEAGVERGAHGDVEDRSLGGDSVHFMGFRKLLLNSVPGDPPHLALRAILSPKGARVVNSGLKGAVDNLCLEALSPLEGR